MEIIKKIWDLYSVKLILALGLAMFFRWASGINFLAGTVLVCLVLFYFIHSFKDPAFKKKKAAIRTAIYFFLIELLVAGVIIMSSSSDPASQSIRSHISSSVVK